MSGQNRALTSRRIFLVTGTRALGGCGFGAIAGLRLAEAAGAAGKLRRPLTDPLPPRNKRVCRIALGSCLRHSEDATILDHIVAKKPDVMLWLGDNVYADADTPDVMRAKYAVLADNPRFQKLFAACPNLAIWDDHDYGRSNGGSDYPMRHKARELFFDFWRIDPRSPRRKHQGIYDAVIAGPPGKEVQILLLDVRYNRSSPRSAQGTLLGASQWRWLDTQLAKKAALRIIASGVQVVNNEHNKPERWDQFPRERDRLFALIRRRRASGVIFVSGDVHRSELNVAHGALGYDAIDLSASGLDQGSKVPPPWHRQLAQLYLQPSFGIIDIDWNSDDPGIKLQVFPADDQSAPVINHWLRLSDLSASKR